MSRRTDRIAEQLRSELANSLRRDVSDPRVQLVTVTKVDVSPDLAQAIVFWSALGDDADLEDIQAGLDAAAGFVRSKLAKKMTQKRMPRLDFRHDATLAEGDATLALLKEIADGEKA